MPALLFAVSTINRLSAEAMMYIVAILRLGENNGAATPLDCDSRDRMLLCLRVLSGQEQASGTVWLTECRRAFADLTNEKQQREAKEAKAQVGQMLPLMLLLRAVPWCKLQVRSASGMHLCVGTWGQGSCGPTCLNNAHAGNAWLLWSATECIDRA